MGISRRNLLKGLGSIPFLGAFGWAYGHKHRSIRRNSGNLFSISLPEYKSKQIKGANDRINLGIIGLGGRGEYLCRSLGYAHPDWIQREKMQAARNPRDTNYSDFLAQENLNVSITAICDLYTKRLERGSVIASNPKDPTGSEKPEHVKVFSNYKDLLSDKEIDAVIVATPDHWHVPISIDAIKAGKHVYQEKSMAITLEQAKTLRKTVHENDRVFQLGHQNHQIDSHIIANELVKQGKLGKISLIQGTTDRYRPAGFPDAPDANPENIDWQQFEMPLDNKHPFSKHRFFRWQNFFDYGLGLFGDLFSHEYAAVNQIMEMGVPGDLNASGGIYLWKENFEVPNVFGIQMNYPEKDLAFIYSLTFGSSHLRERLFMGTDAVMQASNTVSVKVEPRSVQYADKIKNSKINVDKPIYTWPAGDLVDAVTTPTEKYFAKKGVYFTYKNGKWVDSSHLHIKDWLDCIRHGGTPRCHVDLGFQEAVTCIMAKKSYLENRTVNWNSLNETII